jgi:hypothetical protein
VKKAAPEVDVHSAQNVYHLSRETDVANRRSDLKSKSRKSAYDKIKIANAEKDSDYHRGKADQHIRKTNNRVKGIQRAADRLTKEENDLQELSRDTVKSYHSKARKDVGQRVLKGHDLAQTDWKAASKEKTKVAKRLVGLNRANDRLDKREDLEAYAEEIINTILAMEGLEIDQLTESGLEKLGAIVEQVMIDESSDLQELSRDLLGRSAQKAFEKGNVLSRTRGSSDPEVKARMYQSHKFAVARDQADDRETQKANKKRQLSYKSATSGLKKEENMNEMHLDPSIAQGLGYAGAAAGVYAADGAMKLHKWVKGKIEDHKRRKANAEFRKKNPHYYEPGGVFHGRKDDE